MTNGDEEKHRHRRNIQAAKASAQSRKRLAPLRKVVGREIVDSRLIERLECGHDSAAPLMGSIPERRRCLQCLDELEAKVERGEA